MKLKGSSVMLKIEVLAILFAMTRPVARPILSLPRSGFFSRERGPRWRRAFFRWQPAGFALAGTFVGEQGIAANDETLAWISGEVIRRDRLVEQDSCRLPASDEAADRRRPQRGDPVETGGLEDLLDPRLGDHAAITDQNDMLEANRCLSLST